MKTYKIVEERVAIDKICLSMVCDMCKREAEFPDDGYWKYHGGICCGELSYMTSIDGDRLDDKTYNLCSDCAEKLAWFIKNPKAAIAVEEK